MGRGIPAFDAGPVTPALAENFFIMFLRYLAAGDVYGHARCNGNAHAKSPCATSARIKLN